MADLRVVRHDPGPRADAVATVTALLDDDGRRAAYDTITRLPAYAPTPVVDCPELAASLGLATLAVKDESRRLGMDSFKALGGTYAVHRAHARHRTGEPFVATCVTDGNHGAAVAYGARELGVRCVIYLPDVVGAERERAIAALGAEVVRVPGTYDEVTEVNAADARRNGWTVITDTSARDARHPVVVDVMQGYRVLAEELVAQWADVRPTHLLLQAGCGGMAGAVAGHLLTRLPDDALPMVVVVEPRDAACLQASAVAGEPTRVEGTLATVMAGLSVGEVSLLGWRILRQCADAFVTIPDDDVGTAVGMLAGAGVPSGETGAAGVAALTSLRRADLYGALDLTTSSRVLVVSTEG